MQIESQNYVLEEPQFGTSSQTPQTDGTTTNTAIATPSPTPAKNYDLQLYTVIGVGILLIASIWFIRRRKHLS